MSLGFGFALPRLRPLAAAFDPASLFAASEPGIAYDLADASKLYQDSGRTTLVSANGDPIGSVTDLSGNGKHASQATTASKPLWNSAGYASLDGVDDSWATAAIDFTGTDAVTVVVSVRKNSDATQARLLELGSLGADPGSFHILAPSTDGAANYAFRSAGTLNGSNAIYADASVAAPNTSVLTGLGKISTDTCELRVNGVSRATTVADQGAGNYGNLALNIGRRAAGTSPFLGRIYRMIVIGRTLTADELAQAEQWCAEPAGMVLP